MAITFTKKGGIVLEVSGNTDELKKDLDDLKHIGGESGEGITRAFIKASKESKRATQAIKTDVAGVERQLRDAGKAVESLGNTFGTTLRTRGISLVAGAVTAVGVAVYEYATSAKRGEEETKLYTVSLDGLYGSAEEAAKAVDDLRQKIANMGQEQARFTMEQTERQLVKLRLEAEKFKTTDIAGWMGQIEGPQIADNGLNKALAAAQQGTIAAKEFQEAIAKAANEKLIKPEQAERLQEFGLRIISTTEMMRSLQDQAAGTSNSVSEALRRMDEAAKPQNITAAYAIFNKYVDAQNKGKQTATEAAKESARLAVERMKEAEATLRAAEANARLQKSMSLAKGDTQAAQKFSQMAQQRHAEAERLFRDWNKLDAAIPSIKVGGGNRNKQPDLSQNRAVKFAEDAYKKATTAAEQLRLKNIELQASLDGDTLASNLTKIEREYQAQIAAIQKDNTDLLAKQAEWKKKGILNDEAKRFIADYTTQNALLTDQLEKQKQISTEIAKRADMKSALGFDLNQEAILEGRENALATAFEEGYISLEQYAIRLNEVRLAIAQLHQDQGFSTWTEDITLALSQITEGYKGVAAGLTESFGEFFTSFTQGFADSFGQAIVYGDSLKDSLGEAARQAVAGLISSLVQLGIQFAVNAALGQSLAASTMAATTALGVAQGAALSSAYAPAAAMASLASFGGNAAPAMTGISMTTSMAKMMALTGFESGGYTGNMRPDQVAGLVHGQEYVFDADSTRRIGIGALESLRRGSGLGNPAAAYSDSAASGRAGAMGLNVSIQNFGTSKAFSVEQLSENDVRIIARDEAESVVRRDAPRVVARDMDNPNSYTSKSLGRNTRSERRRP